MTDERRKGERFALWFPMKLDSDDAQVGVAVSRNVSDRGVLMATADDLTVGSTVNVTFQPARDAEERTVEGVIVRCEENVDDRDGLWPYRVAVQFDEPLTELQTELKTLLEQ